MSGRRYDTVGSRAARAGGYSWVGIVHISKWKMYYRFHIINDSVIDFLKSHDTCDELFSKYFGTYLF